MDSNLQFQQASGMQTYALDRAATGTGHVLNTQSYLSVFRSYRDMC